MAALQPADLLTVFGIAPSLMWLGLLAHVVAHRHKAIRLHFLAAGEPAGGWPKVAVIVAARDEEAMIGEAVRSLLKLDYPALEVIAVDDRSADRTGAILDEMARDEPRLRVVQIDELPDGWLGKTNAMQNAAAAATDARWLLFTDADVVFAPTALRRAVSLAERDAVDHLVAGPDLVSVTFAERLFLALFFLLAAFKAPIGRVDDRRSKAHIGVGAFNLVRASAFRAIGGLRRVALSVDDDMRLGQAMKYAGYKNKFVLGVGEVGVRWQVGLGGLIRGMEKNFFALVDFRPVPAVLAAIAAVLLGGGPMAGLFFGPIWSRIICGLGVSATALLLQGSAPHSRIRWWYALTLPLSGLFIAYALMRSMILTIRRGGVSWRGRLYPIAELRRHVVLRNHWLNEVWHSTR